MDREAIVWCLCLFSFLVHFMGRCFVWTLYVNAAILNKIPKDLKNLMQLTYFIFICKTSALQDMKISLQYIL